MIAAFDTSFQNPILLAAGTAGFGREVAGVIDLESLGGLITKAVSPEPRHGNPSPRVAEFPGGMLNSVGLANPGLEQVAQVELDWLEEHLHRARVIVNVVGDQRDDYVDVVRKLGSRTVVTAFELNVSCPNTERGGEEFGANNEVLADLVSACRTATDKPIIVKLAPTLSDIAATAEVAAEAGTDGFSVVNTMPGLLYREHGGEHELPTRLGAGQGGVSGPALLPIGVLATRRVRERTGLPVIGIGGICTAEDVKQYLDAGAVLVAVGTAALADPRCPERLARAWGTVG
ncbi:MAG: dihydroorotate dehydrogenase [Gemmatimonadetes bacterium]|nr:dihydroorotate dehydrogenase [Gemmatimonadota bacterium]